MLNVRSCLCFLASCLLLAPTAHSQCYGNAQAEGHTCHTTPVTLGAFTTCGGCTHTWNPAPLAGQNTALATYQYTINTGWGHAVRQVSVSSYNPNVPCSYGDMWQIGVGAQPNIALPSLVNGPWNGDTSKVWLYTRSYLNPGPQASGYYVFNPSWSVTGGTVLQTRHHLTGIYYNDTVRVKWNGSTTMALNEAQLTMHGPPTMVSAFNCNWNPAPTLMAYPSLNIFYNGGICMGATKNFYTFPFANSTYNWSITNGTVVSGQGTNSAQIQVNGPGTVTVVRDSAGTQTSSNVAVTPASPVINLGPDQTLCQGTSVTLDAGPGFTQYTWSTGATTQTIVVTGPGQYHVSANVNGGCIARDTIQIAYLPVTQVNLGPDVHTCTFPVTLDAGPGFASYAWSTGATSQTISASAAGGYQVTVTHANGCQDADTVLVYNSQTTVNLPPTQAFCHPGSVTLTPSYTNATNYLWSTGATTPAITVSNAGTQVIWVQAGNVYGCQASDTITVTSMPRPTPNLGPDQTVCPGTAVTFDAGPGYASYLWNTFATTQQLTASTPGAYRVTVTAANGCTGSDTVQLLNHPFTAPNLGPDINVCQPTATLDAGAGYATYAWSTGATTQSISVSATGSYSVTATDANGCVGSDQINVTFSNVPMTLGPDVTVCQPAQVVLDPQLVGTFTYVWSTGATSPTVTLSTPGTYTVSLTATNTFGCTAQDTVLVTILPTPPSLLGSDTILCADTSITLNVGPGFASYQWSTGATTQSIMASNGGNYLVTATAPNGCVRLDTVNISDLIDCVFPGDVNYDHAVDLLDVLSLGPSMGVNGPTRPAASLNWYGQRCWNWQWSVTSGVNGKQADTDGDGTITHDDTLAIQLNFGSTHTRVGTVVGTQGQLRIVPLNPTVVAGAIAYFGVYYEGDAGTDVDSVHGLALQLTWPNAGLAGAGLVGVDYSMAWFAPGSNHLDFTRTAPNAAYLALSRTSGTDTSGQGLVMTLAFQTDSTMAPGNSVNFAPQVVASIAVGSALVPTSPQSTVTPAHIAGAVALGPQVLTHVSIMPVPADDALRVLVEGSTAHGHIQLLNMLGQVLMELPILQDQWQTLPTGNLPAGTYAIRVQTPYGASFSKVLIAH